MEWTSRHVQTVVPTAKSCAQALSSIKAGRALYTSPGSGQLSITNQRLH